jgi:hypothetical protein
MACADINPSNPELFQLVAGKILEGVTTGFANAGLSPIKRRYVGLGPVPSEDCCPDLVAWISNVRVFDELPPDGLREARILSHYGIAFDVNIRVGDCYFEVNPDNPREIVSAEQLERWSDKINSYGQIAFVAGIQALVGDPDMQCGTSITPGVMNPYQEGGCAGFSFAITVGVFF